jgi:hypothetical protein
MSFLDKTFCASPNCENACGRKITDEEKKKLNQLPSWEQLVSQAYFCGEPVRETPQNGQKG